MKLLKATKFETLHKSAANICHLRAAREKIEQEYDCACVDAIEAVVDILASNPDAIMTCGDIAEATGLPITKVVNTMYSHPRVAVEHQPVERRFVELDENGEPIPGCIKVERYNRTTYKFLPDRRHEQQVW